MLDWRTATSLYAPRVANLLLPLAGAFEEAKKLPSLPLAAPLEMEAQLALNFGLHTLNTLRATREMVHGVKENWASGRFILVTFCARLIVEYLGALSVGEKILTQYALSKDLQKAKKRRDA